MCPLATPRPRREVRPPKTGPLAECVYDGERWVRRLTAEGRAAAESYLADHPHPGAVVFRSDPAVAAVAVRVLGIDEFDAVARLGVCTGVATFDGGADRLGAAIRAGVLGAVRNALRRRVGQKDFEARLTHPSAWGEDEADGTGWDTVPDRPAEGGGWWSAAEWDAITAGLSPLAARVFEVVAGSGLTVAEAARVLDLSRCRVERLLAEARTALRSFAPAPAPAPPPPPIVSSTFNRVWHLMDDTPERSFA